ncbi:carbohydrate porin [Sphingomonas sp. PB4P5]|uniref:carbohydrate porin n=1 Tax=Parasphingomonas puruogangriensis TaxID=3096155 RepID=UPI002FC88AAD
MPHGTMRALTVIWISALEPSLVLPAFAQSGPAARMEERPIHHQHGMDASGNLLGELGGLRPRLREEGVDLAAGYVSESAWNVRGGERERVRETGQFAVSATIDTEKIAGLAGGTFRATVTYRRGVDLGAAAGLKVLQQVQEVYGRGQTWRLTQFWYQHRFAGGHADLKVGRLTQGEDFAAFSCDLQNLSFCGSPPGNVAGDYWYNWPVSQWGARLRVRNDRFYAMAGAYEVNPRNLDNTFTIGYLHGAKGVLVPLEVGHTPRHGPKGLPGSYRIGAWYNTATADDVGLDVNAQPRGVTGLAPLRRKGRYGVYAQFQQQLTGSVNDGTDGPRTKRGLSAFLNVTQTDRRTTVTDNQVAAGATYKGALELRPDDEVTIAIARTNVNANALASLAPGSPRPDAEYAAELAYCLHLVDWLTVRPNLQYVANPGGFKEARDVVIFGLKASLTL